MSGRSAWGEWVTASRLRRTSTSVRLCVGGGQWLAKDFWLGFGMRKDSVGDFEFWIYNFLWAGGKY